MADSVEDLDLTPPQTAEDNAQKVLDWRDEHGDEVNGMTRTGWIRANQLAEGEELSPDIVQRMAQFNRHRSNSGVDEEYEGEPWKDAGRVAWLGWGGDAGVDWAMRMSDRIESIENTGRDTVTTLSHKHSTEDNDLDIMENVNIRSQISGSKNDSSSNVDSGAISLNTYNGYFEDKEFGDQNWENSINRLRQIHGSLRSYITNLMKHEDGGHGRPENVPVFEEPVDTETVNEFVSNVDQNVEEDTFTDLINDVQKMDRTLRELFVEMVEHDNYMHDREDFNVKQLLSENLEKGEDYETVSECVEYHVENKGWSADKSYAVCAEEFDVEMEEDEKLQERKNIKEAEMLAEQVWILKDVMQQFGDEFERIARELETEREEREVKLLKEQTIDAVDLLMTKIKSPSNTIVNEMSEDDDDEESGLITRPRELDEEVSEGDKVRWDSSGGNAYGVVDTVTRQGTISAEPKGPDMDGSEDKPAVKIQVYDIEDDEWVGTETYVVHRFGALEKIDDFPQVESMDEDISEGDKARWNGGGGNAYGVVEDIETNGTLEAEPKGPDMEGTEEDPAYGLRNYEVDDGEWVETDVYVVHRRDAITVIDDFPESEENTETMASGIVPTHEALGDFSTTESDSWDRPDYSEFQDAYDLEENYADLNTEDKRTVAAHFGRVDNDSYEDSTYADLQLPHHDPETGDVDRAGVIAARQRLPQSDMPQDTLDEIDTHLTEHLREDFEEEDVEPIFKEEEENSEDDYRTETVSNKEGLKEGQLVSFDTNYGKSFGRVKEKLDEDYTVEVYRAELGGGWTSTSQEKVFSTEELSEEDKFPDSLNDVFRNNSGSSASAQDVAENSESIEAEDESEENTVEDVGPSRIQQVGRKVRTVSEVLTDDQLNDYLGRNDIDYSVDEFRELVEKF